MCGSPHPQIIVSVLTTLLVDKSLPVATVVHHNVPTWGWISPERISFNTMKRTWVRPTTNHIRLIISSSIQLMFRYFPHISSTDCAQTEIKDGWWWDQVIKTVVELCSRHHPTWVSSLTPWQLLRCSLSFQQMQDNYKEFHRPCLYYAGLNQKNASCANDVQWMG